MQALTAPIAAGALAALASARCSFSSSFAFSTVSRAIPAAAWAPDPGGVSMLPLEWTHRRVGYPSRGPTPHASSAALACAPPGPLSDTRPPSAVRPPSAAAPVV